MVCQPDGTESQADGSIVYNDFAVTSSAGKEAVHQQHKATYEDNFVEDEDTGERFFNNEADDNDYATILESVGGVEAFKSMTDWAVNNLSTEDIEVFNEVINSGDLDYTNSIIQQLAERYYNQDETDNAEQFDEQTEYIFNNVIDREDYEVLVDHVRQNYDADFIDNFNMIVDSGNTEMLRNTIRMIQSRM